MLDIAREAVSLSSSAMRSRLVLSGKRPRIGLGGSGLLPADAVSRTKGHHLLNGRFRVLGEFGDLDASGLLVPSEDLRAEIDA
jgi:hypothetical protein